jgi:hypothetical protein
MTALYELWCPKCEKAVWINNGDEEDMTVTDVDSVICPWCGWCFWVNPDKAEILGRGDPEDGEDGYRTANEAANLEHEE